MYNRIEQILKYTWLTEDGKTMEVDDQNKRMLNDILRNSRGKHIEVEETIEDYQATYKLSYIYSRGNNSLTMYLVFPRNGGDTFGKHFMIHKNFKILINKKRTTRYIDPNSFVAQVKNILTDT